MRADSATALLDVGPGEHAEVVVNVVNTSEVIDGVTARVIGLPEGVVTVEPALLPLFPSASGEVRLGLDIPLSLPAGRHPVSVELVSHGARAATEFLDLAVLVAPSASFRAAARPRVVRSRRRARFVVEVENTGNVAVAVVLTASDVDRACTVALAPERAVVPPATTTAVLVTVRGPRLLFGAELDRVVTIAVAAEAVPLPGADPDLAREALPAQPVALRLRQRALIGRGPLTALVLAAIVVLWAAAVLFGLDRVFAGDPVTKTAPASFFAVAATANGTPTAGRAAGGGAAGGAAAPAGALPKNGSVPAGIGGSITGTITAADDGEPVGRILVEALRRTPAGLTTVSSAASQSDGTFTIAGLFPTGYLVRVSAVGYQPVWYPQAGDQTGAATVEVAARQATSAVSMVVTGDPATISGSVGVGDGSTRVPTTVTARALHPGTETQEPFVTNTDAAGSYTLSNLPAPGSYELSFVAAGYQPTTVIDHVDGGQARIEPAVTLSVTAGSLSGVVIDGDGNPLGGASVSTVVGGQTRVMTTPTTGAVGTFTLGALLTPQTYVLSVSRSGYGSTTDVVDLGGGESRAGLRIAIVAGTGSVSGTLRGPSGGIGGATVTIGGTTSVGATATVPTTTTLTSGQVGAFAVSGLPAPGAYTVTFTAAGYTSVTVPFELSTGNAAPASVTATLSVAYGSVTGTVIRDGGGLQTIVTVTVSSGSTTVATTVASDGGFTVDNLPPAVYSVTASASGLIPATALVTVTAGPSTSVPELTVTATR